MLAVKKFMEKKPSSSSSKAVKIVIPLDVIAEELKKMARKGTSFKGLHKKLFGTGNETTVFDSKKKKEVKEENTRTLAMVLRSERQLLGMNKEREMECLRRRAQRSVTKFFYYFLDRRVAALSSLLYDSDTLVGKTLVYQKCNSNIK